MTCLFDDVTTLHLFSRYADLEAAGLAVSGGADSLALLVLAARWCALAPSAPRLVVYSVDHGLRPEASREVDHVRRICERYGMPFRALVWQGDKPQAGLQAAARSARYRLIGDAMAQDGCQALFTAHHRRDQAETVLMRLAHGSGIEGLRGMDAAAEVEGVRVLRPLLDLDPAQLAALVTAEGLQPVRDPSNDDRDYERVRWRQALPQLDALGLSSEDLVRFARRMGEADQAIEEIATAAFENVVLLDGFGAARVARDDLRRLPIAIGQRVLTRVLNIVGGRQRPHALSQVETLAVRLRDQAPMSRTTLLGCVIRATDDAIVVAREPGRLRAEDRDVAPGSIVTWDRRFRIENRSQSEGFTAGAADYLPRHRLDQVLGFKVTAPVEAIRTAPLVRDGAGAVVALGGYSFDDRVSVDLLID